MTISLDEQISWLETELKIWRSAPPQWTAILASLRQLQTISRDEGTLEQARIALTEAAREKKSLLVKLRARDAWVRTKDLTERFKLMPEMTREVKQP